MASSGNGGQDDVKTRTFLWCVPRSGSTALTKCLTAIEGMNVWFEPFISCVEAKMIMHTKGQIDVPLVYEGNEEIFERAVAFFEAAVRLKPKAEHLS